MIRKRICFLIFFLIRKQNLKRKRGWENLQQALGNCHSLSFVINLYFKYPPAFSNREKYADFDELNTSFSSYIDRGGPSYKTMTRIFAFAVIGGNYFARVVRKNCQPGLR